MKYLYDKIFEIKFFNKLRELPVLSKLLTYEFILYALFGVGTTLVNLTTFYLCDKALGNTSFADFQLFSHRILITMEDVSTLIAWIVSVLFAFVVNKIWVFESRSWKISVALRELFSFVGTRIVSFLVFELLGFMLVRNFLLNYNVFESDVVTKWVAKFSIAVFVILFNYIMSKLFIFKKEDEADNES
ncbi:MAG: GtrA family protein [Clostridia bacterium]|nr:GtrA family protein [Clostridia bacterium]